MDYNIHYVSLPHTTLSKDSNICAYTTKALKFAKMFPKAIMYANEGSEVPHVQIYSKADMNRHFGKLEWYKKGEIYKVDWNDALPYWVEFIDRTIEELKKRVKPRDIICLVTGWTYRRIADAFPNNIVVEPGVGYEGIYTKFRAFESYAWMHYLYGKKGIQDGVYYDRVIPNYFEVEDFPYSEDKEDYLLFMSRPIDRKGIEIVREIASRGHKVITAGAEPLKGKNIEWAGYADTAKRGELMSKAKALLCPTVYIGPFEGVVAEAQLCGTPVITTDWGVFNETVLQKETGYRCRTLKDFLTAVDNVSELNNAYISKRAKSLYSLEAVKPKFQRWFEDLLTLYDKGWYS